MRVFPDLTVDGEFKALGDTGVSGSLNDRQFTYLGNSGYTGALPDRFGEYKGFTPASLFSSASSRGFMFDFRDYNTLFTDTAGTTRVTSTNQAVGLALDKSRGLALGSELLVGAWTLTVDGGTATATESPAGTLNLTGDGTNGANASQSVATVAGRTYKISCTVSASTATVQVGTSSGGVNLLPNTALLVGSREILFVATTATSHVTFRKAGAALTSVSAIAVKELAGNHATQATAGNRPLSVIFPASGVRNRANGSADVGNAGFWPAAPVQNGITATKVASGFDTDGLPYADVRYQGTATGTTHDSAYNGTANARVGGSVGQQFTESALVTRIGGSLTGVIGFRLTAVEETAPTTYIGQTFSSFANSTSETLISTSVTLATGNQARAAVHMSFTSGATIDVTYRIKALQFELGSVRTNYQFNYSAQNVTEPGFASIRGIQFDGVDDWLQTAAIDFSNSDEVTVVAGVRKLSDAARAVVFVQDNAGTQRINLEAPGVALNNYNATSGGTTNIAISAAAAAPNTSIIGIQSKISAPTLLLRRNGTVVTSSSGSQGTGNFSNQPFFIGQNAVGGQRFNGVLTFLFAINRLLTANELAAVEAYANGRTGAF